LLHSDLPHQKAEKRPIRSAAGRGRKPSALNPRLPGFTTPCGAVETVHVVIGIAVVASNLVAGFWGAVAWLRARPSVSFWYLLRVAQATVVVQVLAGAILLLLGDEADGLHYVYGTLPLLVSLLAEAARAGAAERELAGLDFDSLPRDRQRLVALGLVRREMGIMTVSALVVLFLALRAAGTGGGLF
jgi:hypothetical protein